MTQMIRAIRGDPEEPTEPDEPAATSLVSASEKKELYEGTYESSPSSEMSYYGVGRTLNVIEDPFIGSDFRL